MVKCVRIGASFNQRRDYRPIVAAHGGLVQGGITFIVAGVGGGSQIEESADHGVTDRHPVGKFLGQLLGSDVLIDHSGPRIAARRYMERSRSVIVTRIRVAPCPV